MRQIGSWNDRPIFVFGQPFRSRHYILTLIGRTDPGAPRLQKTYGTMENMLKTLYDGYTDLQIVDMLISLRNKDMGLNNGCLVEQRVLKAIQEAMKDYLASGKYNPEGPELRAFNQLANDKDLGVTLHSLYAGSALDRKNFFSKEED